MPPVDSKPVGHAAGYCTAPEPIRMELLQSGQRMALAVYHDDRGRVRQHRTDGAAALYLVWAKHGERVSMPSLQQGGNGICIRRVLSHLYLRCPKFGRRS